MKVLQNGHHYELDQRDIDGHTMAGTQNIQFVNLERGKKTAGVTTQEVIRALIDRTWYCNDCLPWSGNALIVDHLRMALMLHEVRAMIRAVEKGKLKPEFMMVGDDGHFLLRQDHRPRSFYARMPNTGTETGSLNPGVCSHQQPGATVPEEDLPNISAILHLSRERA